jgi:hypothetical protein
VSIPKVIAGVVFNVAFYALLLFVPACTLHWWRAWVFLAVTVVVMALAVFSILPDNADLFSQRAKGIIQKGQPLWDRVLVILLVVSYVGQIAVIPLDVFRFHFAPKPSGLVSFFGLTLYVAGWWIMTLAMKVNPLPCQSLDSRKKGSSESSILVSMRSCGIPCTRGLSRWLWAPRSGCNHMLQLCWQSFPSPCWQREVCSKNDF